MPNQGPGEPTSQLSTCRQRHGLSQFISFGIPVFVILMVGVGLLYMSLPQRALPDAPALLSGFALSPFGKYDKPGNPDDFPSLAQLRQDLSLLAQYSGSVRTYSVEGTLAEIPRLAAEYGLAVMPGIALDEPARLELHLQALGRIAAANDNVRRVIVGNESILTERHNVKSLSVILQEARRRIDAEISTAEPWDIWLKNPGLVEQVDFIAVHVLPYWEGIPVEIAVDYVFMRVAELERAYPGKPVLIAEAGWPTGGRSLAGAIPSRENAARFVREFTKRESEAGKEYFLMEAFDQPFKRRIEGEVGAYWGIFDADREPKFALTGSIAQPYSSAVQTGIAAVAACLLFAWIARRRLRIDLQGNLVLAGATAVVAFLATYGLSATFARYWALQDFIGAVIPLFGLIFAGMLVLVESLEWAEGLGAQTRRFEPGTVNGPLPKVSIHVAAHAEPPDMLIATLETLARLDYPDFEVIVVDNNTDDPALWTPVKNWCESRENFFFHHVSPLAGYKAGALNFALGKTGDDAKIVAVIDSDYQVAPGWLRDLVPAFVESDVGVVQAPQAYRDGRESFFKASCEAEYQGFFDIGMVIRDGRNAIIQHGTMTMIRRQVLEEIGGWAEWTITEDAELGLRVLEHGYRALYTPDRYGTGLTADNFSDYKSQRYRWAFGAIQILKHHRAQLLGIKPSRLNLRQRYEFIAGWLPWFADAANLFFSIGAIFWTLGMLLMPGIILAPGIGLTGTVMGLFAFKLVKMAVLYRKRVGATFGETGMAALAGLSLVYTVGRAVLAGIFRDKAVFVRTPKLSARGRFRDAIYGAAAESLLAACLLGAAVGVELTGGNASVEGFFWSVLLGLLAVAPVSALIFSLAAVFGIRRGTEAGEDHVHELVHRPDGLGAWDKTRHETGTP